MAGEKVLVIEDNEANMILVTALLKSSGWIVIPAMTAEEGIKIAKDESPALVLMDISLPGMDGLTATGILKKDPQTKDIPVVALTAHAMKGDEIKALTAGCIGYITKPIDTRSFPKAVSGYIKGYGSV